MPPSPHDHHALPLPWQAPTCPPALRHPAGPAGWSVGALLVEGEVGGGGGSGGGACGPGSSGPGGAGSGTGRALILRCRAGWGGQGVAEGEPLAVKACLCGGDRGRREEARREAAAQAAVAVTAPPGCVLPLHAAFEDEGGLYLAMPLAGPSARAAARTAGGFLPEAVVARLARAGAAALGAAAAAGWAHGDVKPENFLSVHSSANSASASSSRDHLGGEGAGPGQAATFALADWGSAVRLGAATPPGLGAGTLDYLPPERAAAALGGRGGCGCDSGGCGDPAARPPLLPASAAAADVWALGVTVVELLTGAPPFERASAEATLRAIAAAGTDPPWLTAHLSPAAEEWVRSALAVDPAARPGAAALAVHAWVG